MRARVSMKPVGRHCRTAIEDAGDSRTRVNTVNDAVGGATRRYTIAAPLCKRPPIRARRRRGELAIAATCAPRVACHRDGIVDLAAAGVGSAPGCVGIAHIQRWRYWERE